MAPTHTKRKQPGETGEGNFYRIVVRSKYQFVSFRTDDVGDKGHVERLAGKRASGSWDTHAWLISKDDAHMEGKKLIADSADAKEIIKQLGSQPVLKKGMVFTAKDKPNVPERLKPTLAQQKARKSNIKKAQAARQQETRG
jgi:hypothetical protein